MEANDLKILSYANKATIVIVVEELVFLRPRFWLMQLFCANKFSRIKMSPEIESHPDIDSIKRLTSEGYLEKAATEEVPQAHIQ